jgi:hypothetical protein
MAYVLKASHSLAAKQLPRGDYGAGFKPPRNLRELKILDFKEDLICGFYRGEIRKPKAYTKDDDSSDEEDLEQLAEAEKERVQADERDRLKQERTRQLGRVCVSECDVSYTNESPNVPIPIYESLSFPIPLMINNPSLAERRTNFPRRRRLLPWLSPAVENLCTLGETCWLLSEEWGHWETHIMHETGGSRALSHCIHTYINTCIHAYIRTYTYTYMFIDAEEAARQELEQEEPLQKDELREKKRLLSLTPLQYQVTTQQREAILEEIEIWNCRQLSHSKLQEAGAKVDALW